MFKFLFFFKNQNVHTFFLTANLEKLLNHRLCVEFLNLSIIKLTGAKQQLLNKAYFKFIEKRVFINKTKFVYLNTYFFYKNILVIFNLLYEQLKEKVNFFIFSQFNIMRGIFNLLKFAANSHSHVQFNDIFSISKKNANYYYVHSILHVLYYNFNVNTLIVLDGVFARYNLHAFRDTKFILVGAVSSKDAYHHYDYLLFFKVLTFDVIYGLYSIFSLLYFTAFFENKWFYTIKYFYNFNKNAILL